MTRNVHIGLWILAVALVLFLFARFGKQLLAPILQNTSLPREISQQSGLPVAGSEAPEFELSDLSGNRVRLSDFAHTPLLVTFWSTKDADGRDQIKILDDWITAHPDALFDILTVNSMEEKSVGASFISRGGYATRVLLDKAGAAGGAYGIQTLPASFFIDSEGVIREISVGIMSQKIIEKKSEHILR